MEDHAQSGWLCDLLVGSGGAQMREVSLSSFWWIQEQPSMSVGFTTSHTLR